MGASIGDEPPGCIRLVLEHRLGQAAFNIDDVEGPDGLLYDLETAVGDLGAIGRPGRPVVDHLLVRRTGLVCYGKGQLLLICAIGANSVDIGIGSYVRE